MKKSLLTIIISISALVMFSQSYKTSYGVRTGYTSGFMAQFIIDDNKYFNSILSFRNRGLQVTGLRQFYKDFSVKGTNLHMYYGYGAHVGYSNYHFNYNYHSEIYITYEKRFCPEIGIDGNLGAEYHLTNMPFAICLDYKPFLQIIGNDFLETHSDWALTFKYTIN